MEVCRMLRDSQRANEKGTTINVEDTQGLLSLQIDKALQPHIQTGNYVRAPNLLFPCHLRHLPAQLKGYHC